MGLLCHLSSTSPASRSSSSFTTYESNNPYPPLSDYSLNLQDESVQASLERSNTQVKHFHSLLQKVQQGGSPQAVERHFQRNKLLPRQRMERLVDFGTPLLELSALAGNVDNLPSAGIVTAIGCIHSKWCMLIGNDATVQGGTYSPMTAKKHLRAQQVAMENDLPCIYLVDSGGAYLPQQAEVFPDAHHFGRIFYNQSRMSSQNIAQIAVVCGSCTAGGAYVPSLSDETIIVKDQGTIFLGGPPLVKAATGVDVTSEELGGAHVHTHISGVADHLADNEEDAMRMTRNIVASIGNSEKDNVTNQVMKQGSATWEEPLFSPTELRAVLPLDAKQPLEIRTILARILDGSRFQEFKRHYGTTIVCGFGKIMGQEVGIVANNGILFSESSLKATHFIQLCCQRGIPLVFLQNITGFMIGTKYEHEGIAKHGAKLVMAVSNATVPKITVVVGGSFGAGNYGMAGRAFGPRFLYMWPSSKIAVMGGEQAANVLTSIQTESAAKKGKPWSTEQEETYRQSILQKYEEESSAYYSTSRLWDDGIIDPADTRHVLGYSLAIARRVGCQSNDTKYGVFRM